MSEHETITVYNTGETDESLKKEYNPDNSDLRKAQIRMTEMLEFLDDICKKENIEYFITFGTLLGAKRHKGFIPWDDDVDICMSCKDIKKLANAIKRLPNCNYIIQNHSSDKGYVRLWHVLRDTQSEYVIDDYIHNARKYKGVQIDLFPYGKGVIKLGRKLVHMTVRINEIYLLEKHPVLSNLWFIGTKYFLIPLLKLCSLFADRKVISCGYESTFNMDLNESLVFPLSRIEFEGLMLRCPFDVDRCLKLIYGEDYMNLPPKNKRATHSVNQIKFY